MQKKKQPCAHAIEKKTVQKDLNVKKDIHS